MRYLYESGQPMLVLQYDVQKLGLLDWARTIFGINELDKIHELDDPAPFENYVERMYYRVAQLKNDAASLSPLLQQVRDELVTPIVGKVSKFQIPPSIRCHLSGGGTASAFHKDGDPKYGVSANALNLWIPLTHVWGNNSLHIERDLGTNSFREVKLTPGEVLIFDAYNLTHGSYANDTKSSRISLDIRFVPDDLTIAKRLGLYALKD